MQSANKLFNFENQIYSGEVVGLFKKARIQVDWFHESRKVYKVKLSRVFLGRTNLKSFYSSDVGDNVRLFSFFFFFRRS